MLNQVRTLLNLVRTLLNQLRILLNRVLAEFSFLIRLVCLPVTWDWLLPTQVQAVKFNQHQPWPLPPLLPAPVAFAALPPLPSGLGAGGGSSPEEVLPSGGEAGGSAAMVVAEAGAGAAPHTLERSTLTARPEGPEILRRREPAVPDETADTIRTNGPDDTASHEPAVPDEPGERPERPEA